MSNFNNKPNRGLPAPAIPVLILVIWVVLWLVNDLVYNLPKWADVTVIILTIVLFLLWSFGFFSKQGE